MDALTAKAIQALLKKVLPKLEASLKAADAAEPSATGVAPLSGGSAPAELLQLASEARQLLELVETWAQKSLNAPSLPSAEHGNQELGDDEAMAMLAAMDAPMPAATSVKSKSVPIATQDVPADDMSDEEAQSLLAQMDGSDLAPIASKVPDAKGEMSDDEAKALLAEMDGSASTSAPKPGAEPHAEMSDDDARALLAQMDAPAPVGADTGEMSDDEAKALLAAMDDPVEASSTKPVASPALMAPKISVQSAEDEALAMLKTMGGAETEEPNSPPAAPVRTVKPVEVAPEPEDHLAEIDEFAKNDFASDPDMMNDFVTNTDELMETLDKTVLQLEQNPKDRETIEAIFRAAHTLKGAAGMFGFKAIERVMHRMENLFDQVRKGILVPDSNTIDVVFQGLDVLKTLLQAVKGGKPSGTKTVPIVRALELAASGRYTKGQMERQGATQTPAKEDTSAKTTGASPSPQGENDQKSDPNKKKSTEQSTIRVDLERLDALVNLVGELVIDRTRFASIEEDIRTTSPQMKVSGNMTETVQLFGRHMNEIHEIVMKIRMVPIGNAFNKFQRIVRDLSRQLGKEIELYVEGEETELDKTLVEQIGDPLIHLIRNSCDHGVEMPDVRAAAGKKRAGSIWLSARQEGNHILITIQDDGKGLPVEVIRRKAIERGLIKEDAVLSKRDVFNLIFEPGFSTAEKVTNISGRGVGMDVVRKQISKLKGLIDIDSEPGNGTTITIRLPLTLAIMQSLLVEAGGECFAVPLSTVIESVRIKPEEIQNIGDTEVIKRHGKVLPLLHLHEVLELSRRGDVCWYAHKDPEQTRLSQVRIARRKERLYVVIVGTGDRRFGLVVDQLLNQQEMVIKSLGPVLRKIPCVAGGAVLGNGEVVLVLDIQELEDRFRSRARSKAA